MYHKGLQEQGKRNRDLKEKYKKQQQKQHQSDSSNFYDSNNEESEQSNTTITTGQRFNIAFFEEIENHDSDDGSTVYPNGTYSKYHMMITEKRYLTYVKQIKFTLKSVMNKTHLLEIKSKIEN